MNEFIQNPIVWAAGAFLIGSLGVMLINKIPDGKFYKWGFAIGGTVTKFGMAKIPGWRNLENVIQVKLRSFLDGVNAGLDSDDK